MFYCLTGEILAYDTQSIAINCGGVGFKCFTTLNTLKNAGTVGSKTTLYTHLSVKEDALDLYGFYDTAELDCFRLLITVSGVGPKAAIAILSYLTPDSLALCIASGDSKSITKAPGIGPKIAQRIVLELKNKLVPEDYANADEIESVANIGANGNTGEAIAALTSLGYPVSEASKAVAKAPSGMTTENLIKYALRQLAKFN